MIKWLAAGVGAAAVFTAGDFLWLTLMTPRLYRPALGPILADRANIPAAVVFYLLYLAGVMVFGVAPGVGERSWIRSLASGAFLGLVAYGTYDLTNQATLKVWSVKISLTDMGWGALITGLASVAGCLAALSAGKR